MKLHHKLQNTCTMSTQSMILSFELSIISYIISSLLTPSWTSPNAYKSPSASRVQPPSREIFIWHWMWHIPLISFFIICSIYHVLILTKNALLLTLSLQSKLFFEIYLHLFHKSTLNCPNPFKLVTKPSYYFTLTSTIDLSACNNDIITASSNLQLYSYFTSYFTPLPTTSLNKEDVVISNWLTWHFIWLFIYLVN